MAPVLWNRILLGYSRVIAICVVCETVCFVSVMHRPAIRPALTGRVRSRLAVVVYLSCRRPRLLPRPCSSMAARLTRTPVNATAQTAVSLCAPLGASRGDVRVCHCHRRGAASVRRQPCPNAKLPKSRCQKRDIGPSECRKLSSPVHMMSAQCCNRIDVVSGAKKSCVMGKKCWRGENRLARCSIATENNTPCPNRVVRLLLHPTRCAFVCPHLHLINSFAHSPFFELLRS